MNLLIFSMSVPSQLLLIPLYDQLLNLGLVNTRTGLILIYIALYFPFSLFVLTGFFRTLPKELEESAIIDGCGEFRMFARIMPVSYTHLDVYKRQTYAHAYSGALGKGRPERGGRVVGG